MSEQAIKFECGGVPLVGILHRAAQPAKKRGIVMAVAGGPQYRVGGHRQLVLWARRLAAEGYPVLRFDYRGWGDSHGEFHDYFEVDEDIRAAIDRFAAEEPGLEEIVLWGECNAASAILFYAYRDPRVRGLVLQNPWVRSEGGQARTLLRHYYLMRLRQPEFWQKLFSFKFNPWESLRSLARLIVASRAGAATPAAEPAGSALAGPLSRELPLPERMFAGFSRFHGPVMLVMSNLDLIAREFDEAVRAQPAWSALLSSGAYRRHDMPEGDHTFSSAEQRGKVVSWAIAWLASW